MLLKDASLTWAVFAPVIQGIWSFTPRKSAGMCRYYSLLQHCYDSWLCLKYKERIPWSWLVLVCVHKLDPANSEGSNAARMVLLSPDPAVNSITHFLLKETRKKRLLNVTAIPAHGTAHPHQPVRKVWLGCGVRMLRSGTDVGCGSLNRLVWEGDVLECGRASSG